MKKTHVVNIFSLVAVLLLTTSAAFARPAAPEIDPSMAVGAIALLAGSIAVLRARLR